MTARQAIHDLARTGFTMLCILMLLTGIEACADEYKWMWRMAGAVCAALLAQAWRNDA